MRDGTPIHQGRPRNRFPAGWSEDRVRTVLEHYDQQPEDDAVAEDEAALRLRGQTVIVIPKRLPRSKSDGRER